MYQLDELGLLCQIIPEVCIGKGVDQPKEHYYDVFDHNLQTFRIVTRLERRYAAFDGLNLTLETLEGLVKHNGPIAGAPPGPILEHPVASKMRLDLQPPLEAQLAAIADDVAYANHDLDDGLRAGFLGLDELASLPLASTALAEVDALFPGLETPRRVHETIRRLIDGFRDAGLPVVFTTVAYDDAAKQAAAAFIAKVPALLTLEAGSQWTEIDPRIAPRDDEPVLTKLWASAFHGTPLASLLTAHACDSLVVTGASTSGCIRATAVDALQHGYRVLVPSDAVGDRNPAAHEANLYDIDTKYGDVVTTADVLAGIERSS